MSEVKLRALTKQLPHNLGGSAIRVHNDTGNTVYEFRDSQGQLVTTSLSTAWRWVCTQYGIATGQVS